MFGLWQGGEHLSPCGNRPAEFFLVSGTRFTPLFIDAARPCRHAAGDRWFVDGTYVKVAGRWMYLYRAVDQFGQVIDVLAGKKRDLAATRWFWSMSCCPPRTT